MRNPNTTSGGRGFDEATISAVWNRGQAVAGNDSDVWRKDACGAFMKRSAYGDTTSKYGWEVDHVKPVAKGGGDELSNLQPLQWQNNRSKSDGPLACSVTG
jgi:5-methylcytosine-specific restriction endonuclease McrA